MTAPPERRRRLPAVPGRAWWPRGRAADVADAILAGLVLVVTLWMSVAAAKPADRPLWPGGLALIAAGAGALAWRRRYPVAVLLIAVVVPPLYYPLGYPDGPVFVVLWVALFTAAVESRLLVSLGAVIVINAEFLAVAVTWGGGGDPDAILDARGVASLSIGLLLAVGLGQYVRSRREMAEAALRRAAQAERDREEEARRRAVAERLRIARELHDVLAHQISLINVQAGAALHRRDDADRAYTALEAIKTASKETLRELREVLGVLRQVDAVDAADGAGKDERGDGVAVPPPSPVPALERIGDLLDRTAAAGLSVRRAGDLAGSGEEALAGLPAPVGLAGYRIVQEALTNVVRHSGATSVTVEVRRLPGEVVVRVDDDGTGPGPAAAGGNGLRGMRERAAAAGGELTAGPGPAGGFRVWARLPLDGAAELGEREDEA